MPAILIFAAGFGTRMGALTRDRPKPLIPVGGRALIDHALDLASDAGAEPVVVNLHYKAAMLRDHLAGRGVTFSEETPDILETGGGLRAALPLLRDGGTPGPVLTLNSDVIWRGPNPLSLLTAAWDGARMDALLCCVPLSGALGHQGAGDFHHDAGGRVARGPGVVYGGAQMIDPGVLPVIDDAAFSLNRVWDRLIDSGRLALVVYPGTWCDVGNPAGLNLAETLLAGAHGPG